MVSLNRANSSLSGRAENLTLLLYPLETGYETGFFEVLCLLVLGVFYMGLLSLVDSPLLHSLLLFGNQRLMGRADGDKVLDRGPRLAVTPMDPEVAHEAKKVVALCRERNFKNNVLVVRNLHKSFGRVRSRAFALSLLPISKGPPFCFIFAAF